MSAARVETAGAKREFFHEDSGNSKKTKKAHEEDHQQTKEGLLLIGLGNFVTSSMVSTHILSFLNVHDLLSVRATNKFLHEKVSHQELLSRSLASLPTHLSLRKPEFNIDFNIDLSLSEGWSPHHTQKAAAVQAALDVANIYGRETRGIVYEEVRALQTLEAGQYVTLNQFGNPTMEAGNGEEEDNVNCVYWYVQAPELHESINAWGAWIFVQDAPRPFCAFERRFDGFFSCAIWPLDQCSFDFAKHFHSWLENVLRHGGPGTTTSLSWN